MIKEFNINSKDIKKDEAINIVSMCGANLEYLMGKYSGDKDVVLAAVSQHGSALRFASEELKDDEDIIHAAISTEPASIFFASDRLGTAYMHYASQVLEKKFE